jgi:hypothetical protein
MGGGWLVRLRTRSARYANDWDAPLSGPGIIHFLRGFNLSFGEVAHAVGARRGRVWEWQESRVGIGPRYFSRLTALRNVVLSLAQLRTPDEVAPWLRASCLALDGRRPLDVLAAGGAADVVATIVSAPPRGRKPVRRGGVP